MQKLEEIFRAEEAARHAVAAAREAADSAVRGAESAARSISDASRADAAAQAAELRDAALARAAEEVAVIEADAARELRGRVDAAKSRMDAAVAHAVRVLSE